MDEQPNEAKELNTCTQLMEAIQQLSRPIGYIENGELILIQNIMENKVSNITVSDTTKFKVASVTMLQFFRIIFKVDRC